MSLEKKRMVRNVRSALRSVQQALFPVYNSKSLIITGWPASGSTFIYQAARMLNIDVHKSHGKRKKTMNFTLFTFRDPRDIICSQAKRIFKMKWDQNDAETALLNALDLFVNEKFELALFQSARMKNVFLIRYEDYFLGNEHLLVDFIADNFLITLTEQKRNEILQGASIDANIELSKKLENFYAYDRDSHIHGNHITNKGLPGAWKKNFTPLVTKRVKENIGKLLIDLGYETNYDWSPDF